MSRHHSATQDSRFNSKLVRLKEDEAKLDSLKVIGFNSKLVRLKGKTGRRKGFSGLCFNSKLVRLKGFVKTLITLYAILVCCVKLIFRITISMGVLLSISGHANSLGG